MTTPDTAAIRAEYLEARSTNVSTMLALCDALDAARADGRAHV